MGSDRFPTDLALTGIHALSEGILRMFIDGLLFDRSFCFRFLHSYFYDWLLSKRKNYGYLLKGLLCDS